jgi:hypothetical protein
MHLTSISLHNPWTPREKATYLSYMQRLQPNQASWQRRKAASLSSPRPSYR